MAQFKLGEMYEQGLAVDRDLDVAKSWYQKAAAQGHEAAQQRLDALARPAAAASLSPADPQGPVPVRLGLGPERDHQRHLARH